MEASKPTAHKVKTHYKAALTDTSSADGGREVLVRSFRTQGDLVEVISVETTRSKDDAYIQGIREEILGKPPFNGGYARKMGLFHIATRRVSHESNDVLYRHTNPKKERNGEIVLDHYGKPVYFPRSYILRLVSDEERAMGDEQRAAYRKKVLSTVAYIQCEFEKARSGSPSRKQSGSKATPSPKAKGKTAGSPPRQFSASKFNVPKTGWDLTPLVPRPLDWYITDQMVATVIHTIYVEEDIGAWHMFQENVDQADCFFSSPYSYVAKTFGFRNPGESSVREPVEDDRKRSPSVEQAFDAGDVLPLH